ncbi:uroporphyrinogen decarboxylase [Rossellomorea vietnamensis]|jgi:uroporphyrinogen decarboxylase|uniref:Uroporphyrinogen decarboxylase n=1 Tax=Rossellomorea vietnamensis TaxID=218284 RepID=A0A6I6UQ36_9BACI|nr:uroporphyrinogen decarboxylase [Rossellomorea vietnamensis]OXS57024.1 uroporphyrinogen decarboxylase [Bacillus sp. DSM 27956]PRX73336.1 uroporphyrinogen decarboxylase [Bacillus sp. V-88]MCA0149061.1 uroporphyrinogen decarboxylase [Rossellomorea vietnamensis]MCC5802971.1 uroporphyrinogen decarboxylase [Rossellomorea vietnamensis]QHE60913.1 uroporphyrinogen decarboxylase [Rossellomorea vietnamensis]
MKQMNDTFLRAARGEETDYTPVWYMRQAGRSQPEYRKIKEKYSLFEITHQPELCAYVTRLPVEQYDVDAAILYKDIMSPLPSIGVDVEIKSGIGPVIDNPIRTTADVEKLGEINPEQDVPYVLDTIKLLTQEQLSVPLIGFAGAPFTMASYMIEGGPSKNYNKTKAFMYAEPQAWFALMDKLAAMTITYGKAQIKAGASAFQIFDSWVGALNVQDYRTFIKPVMERIFNELKEENVPLIMFGVGASHLANEWHDLPIDVVGLDWRLPIKEARERGISKTVMGNLDPAILLAPWDVIEEKAKEILDQGKDLSHIFNLGHGVFPQVNPDTLKRLAAFVHEYSAR